MVLPDAEIYDSGKNIFTEDIDIAISYVAQHTRFCQILN